MKETRKRTRNQTQEEKNFTEISNFPILSGSSGDDEKDCIPCKVGINRGVPDNIERLDTAYEQFSPKKRRTMKRDREQLVSKHVEVKENMCCRRDEPPLQHCNEDENFHSDLGFENLSNECQRDVHVNEATSEAKAAVENSSNDPAQATSSLPSTPYHGIHSHAPRGRDVCAHFLANQTLYGFLQRFSLSPTIVDEPTFGALITAIHFAGKDYQPTMQSVLHDNFLAISLSQFQGNYFEDLIRPISIT